MSTTVIKIGSVDVSADVIYADAVFDSRASGIPGTCLFRLKDMSHAFEFTAGEEITVDIDGVRRWGGYLLKIHRQFFFDVADARQPTLVPRNITIEGVDWNILFQRRYTVDKAHPTNLELTGYPRGTSDYTIITDLCSLHLDLSGDGLDTVTKVESIGSPVPDMKGNPAAGGWKWDDAMHEITRVLGTIYYIDPEKFLVHTDVNTANAPFDLSDQPDGVTSFGYRDLQVLADGGKLANDSEVWGIGQGSSKVKFHRTQDAPSIAAHGLWQVGEFRSDMWRQTTVNKRSESLIYGSPSNLRGAKDDAMSVVCTVFQPGLVVAQKVNFTSVAHDYSDVIPIRRMEISWVNPSSPRFKLTLSHYIDEPWDMHEYWFPKFRIPKFIFNPYMPGPQQPGGAPPCDEVTLDDFNRSNRDLDGDTASGGGTWTVTSGQFDILSDQAHTSGTSENSSGFATLDKDLTFPGIVAIDFQIVYAYDAYLGCTFNAGAIQASLHVHSLYASNIPSLNTPYIEATLTVTDGTNTVIGHAINYVDVFGVFGTMYIDFNDPTRVRAVVTGLPEIVVFLGAATPGAIADLTDAQSPSMGSFGTDIGGMPFDDLRQITNVDCTSVSSCITDTFNRASTSSPDGGLGASDAGPIWVEAVTNSVAHPGRIGASYAVLDVSSSTDSAGGRLPGAMPFPFQAIVTVLQDGQGTAFPTDANANHNYMSVLLNSGAITATVEWTEQEFGGRHLVLVLTDGTNTVSHDYSSGLPAFSASIVPYRWEMKIDAENLTVIFPERLDLGPFSININDASPSPIATLVSASDFEIATTTTTGTPFIFDNLDILGLVDCPQFPGGGPTPGVPTGPGPGFEIAKPTSDPTIFTVSHAYVALSTEVWVDGIFQTRGDTISDHQDYEEMVFSAGLLVFDGPGEAKIKFTSVPASTKVYVRYTADWEV